MQEREKNALMLAAAGLGVLLAGRAALRKRREYDFRGKSVLITGGSRGLGLVMAREFAREGARLAICARDAVELERARTDLEGRGAEVLAITCDVTNKKQVDEMVEMVRRRYGQIDVLVNNAGVIQVGPIEEMTLEDYDESMQAHFWGPLYMTLAVLPDMQRRKSGRIVNITSIGGKIGVPHLVPYSASKFALVGLSEGMRAELAKDGIAVTTVCPGLMRTGSPRNAFFKGQNKREYAWFTISDSLPITAIKAERAARQIIAGCKRGDAEVIITIQAVLAIKFHQLFPELSADMRELMNRLLPGPGGIGRKRAKGKESQSEVVPSVLTTLTEMAAKRNNEMI